MEIPFVDLVQESAVKFVSVLKLSNFWYGPKQVCAFKLVPLNKVKTKTSRKLVLAKKLSTVLELVGTNDVILIIFGDDKNTIIFCFIKKK